MKTKLLLPILILIFSGLTTGQTFLLKGKITDSKTNSPLKGAVVFISSKHLAYTNNDGVYFITNLNSGTYTVKISSLGYKTLSTQLELKSNEEKNFSLEPSAIELDEVLVSTNRTENYLKNSPFAEELVGKDELQKRPSISLPDILQNEPGVSLLRDGIWGTEISIRGLNRENVLTLIDGNRIATSTDVAARLSLMDMNDVERVEIIKGASSSIYGSGATGGIVNIITKTPQTYDHLSLNGNFISEYNSVNDLSVFGGSLYGGSSIWSGKISGSYRNAHSTQTPRGELKNSQFKDYSFSAALNFFPFDNHKLKFDYQLFRADDVGIPGSSVFPLNADVRYPFERRELFSAGYDVQNISKVFYRLSLKYSYQLINRDVENIPNLVQNIPASAGNPARRISVLKITPGAEHKNNNATLQGNFQLIENNNLVAGIDYWDRSYKGERERYQLIEVLDSAGNVIRTTDLVTGDKPLPDSRYSSLGILVQDEHKFFNDRISSSLGLRYDFINITGEKTLTPIYTITNGVLNTNPPNQQVLWNSTDNNNSSYSANLGFIYSVFSDLDLTLGLGSSFRSPSLEERFQYIDQGSIVRVGNPELKPEKGQSIDFGIRHYSNEMKIISSFFYTYFKDLVTEIPGTYEGRNALIKTNIGEARIYGFDFSADYNFWQDYIIYASASYVKGDDITADGNLPEIPPFNGRVGLKFGLLNYLQADINTSVFAAQNDVAVGEMTTPGYAVFNFYFNSVPVKFLNIGFRIYTGVENIFDKAYRNHLSTTRGSITTEPGRNIFLKLAVDF